MPINIINNIISITSYFLALFVGKYLYTNKSKLAFEELNILEELKQSILSSSIIQLNRNIDK